MLDKLNIGLIWAAISGTAAVMLWAFSTFATADEVEAIELKIAYGQYYDRLDDYDEAIDEGNEELAEEYLERMEQLAAMICEHDPQWRRCRESQDDE